jgi:threonine dehydratase
LISGVAAALKDVQSQMIRIVGISMERGAAMHASLKRWQAHHGRRTCQRLADSLGGGIGLENQLHFRHDKAISSMIIILVTETDIAAAIRHVYWHERQIIEGSGSVGCCGAADAARSESRRGLLRWF